MNAQERIKEALKSIMSDGEASACQVYKAWDYDGNMYIGWFYKMFNRQPSYLGKNVDESLETIENIADSRE